MTYSGFILLLGFDTECIIDTLLDIYFQCYGFWSINKTSVKPVDVDCISLIEEVILTRGL